MKHLFRLSFFLTSILFSQNSETINGRFSETGIFLKELHFDWNHSLGQTKTSYSIDLNEFDFGFSNFIMIHNKIGDLQNLETNFIGPELSIKQLNLTAKLNSKNWLIAERIRRLNKRQSIPIEAIEIIANSVNLYYLDYGESPRSLNDLHVKQYINLDDFPFNNSTWTYDLELPNQIVASPTRINSTPKIKPIILNWKSKEFIFDHKQDSLIKIPFVDWNYSINIKSLFQIFSSKIQLNYAKKSKSFDFLLKEGQFQIQELNLTAIPGQQLNNRTEINLPSFIITANNIALSGSLGDKPIIHEGHFSFSIRNFEIKLPQDLEEEPEIQAILESLGIWNNLFVIRHIQLEMNLTKDYMGDLKLILHTPFLKININGDFSLQQDETHPEILLHQMEININPISMGVRKWIRNWEKKTGKTLNRKGSTISLKVDGTLENPVIHGY